MQTKVLILLPSYNLYGGTPKKTLDLVKKSRHDCYLYVWTNAYANEFKARFTNSNATIVEGNYGRNLWKHVRTILEIIDTHHIEVIHSQFFFGELLVGIIRRMRPHLKVLIAFVGSLSPGGYRNTVLRWVYKKANAFVYISNYVKREKVKVFPTLQKQAGHVIYNGTENPIKNLSTDVVAEHKDFVFLCVSGLTKIKNIQVVIDAVKILKTQGQQQVKVLVAGDGPLMEDFKHQISENALEDYIQLLGYQSEVGKLLLEADAFLHPCYVEGFGIAVAEAMMAAKPIIGANAGALPELLEDTVSGLTVDPFEPVQWAEAMIQVAKNPMLAEELGMHAKVRAEATFSVDAYVNNYDNLYESLITA